MPSSNEPQDNFLRDGERRTVTILFSDMQGFSELSEHMDPEEIDSIMNTVFDAYREIVERQEGTVEKYIGDALVAVFGVPRIHGDDPQRAVHTALDFLDEIAKLNSELSKRNLQLQFRTGIHTGLITTGHRGEHRVVTGHAMSIASRLESHAPPNGILVSIETKEQCENDFVFSSPAKYAIKGSRQPITAFKVLSRAAQPYPSEGLFTGREKQLDILTSSYVKHSPLFPGRLGITGEAGVGKSALLGRFLNHIRAFPGFSAPILYARARRFRNRPFAVCTEALATYFGLQQNLSHMENVQRILHMISLPQEIAEGFIRFFHTPESVTANKVFAILDRMLDTLLSSRQNSPYSPLLCIDDAGFLDQQSMELLQYRLENSSVHPFMLLVDRTRHQLAENVIHVPPLSIGESEQLIDALCSRPLEESLRKQILEACEGNPLFIREYVRFIEEHPDSSELPATMQNIFLASIDRFPNNTRDLLKKLTVFVLNFTCEDAQYLHMRTEGDPGIVPEALNEFVQMGFLVQDNHTYSFRHEVFKRGIYDSMLHYNRRILHQIIADLMLSSDRPHTLRLLHHLIKAENYIQAAAVLAEADQNFINMDYLPFIDSILQHTDFSDTDARALLLFNKSALLFNNGHTIPAEKSLNDIIEIALSSRNSGHMATAYHLLTAYNIKRISYDTAYFTGRKALRSYPESPESVGLRLNVLALLSTSELMRNHPETSIKLIEEMKKLRDTYQLPEERCGEITRAQGEHALLTGDYSLALQKAQERIYQIQDSGHLHRVSKGDETAMTFILLTARALWERCDYEALADLIPPVAHQSSRHFSGLCTLHIYLAAARQFLGNTEESQAALKQADLYLYRIPNEYDRLTALCSMVDGCLVLQRPELAEQYAMRGMSLGLQFSARSPSFSILAALIELSCTADKRDDARFYLREAEHIIEHGCLLGRKDRILYYGFSRQLHHGLSPDAGQILQSLLCEEQQAIGDKRLYNRWLSTRSYGMIASESE